MCTESAMIMNHENTFHGLESLLALCFHWCSCVFSVHSLVVCLCVFIVHWLVVCSCVFRSVFTHWLSVAGKRVGVSYAEWDRLIQNNFEKYFWINATPDPKETAPNLINKRGIYKDVVFASHMYTEYQLRPNFPIALVVVSTAVRRCYNLQVHRLGAVVSPSFGFYCEHIIWWLMTWCELAVWLLLMQVYHLVVVVVVIIVFIKISQRCY